LYSSSGGLPHPPGWKPHCALKTTTLSKSKKGSFVKKTHPSGMGALSPGIRKVG
jgi:hypothetical protein